MGSLEENKLADIVLWDPAFFGVKPEKIIKGGAAKVSNSASSNDEVYNRLRLNDNQIKSSLITRLRKFTFL